MVTWKAENHIGFGEFKYSFSNEQNPNRQQVAPKKTGVELSSIYCAEADKLVKRQDFEQFPGGIGGDFTVMCQACNKQDTFNMSRFEDDAA